jgi:deoxyadenosine/deoxycytidine kinase
LDLPESETLVSQKYQKYQKTSNQKYQKYQKHQSRNPQIRFEGEKLDFLRSKYTRLLASAKRTSW